MQITGRKQNDLARFRNEHIGFVFQFHYLLPEFTALQNVMLPALRLGRYGKKEVEERAFEKLRLLGMHEQAHKPSNKLLDSLTLDYTDFRIAQIICFDQDSFGGRY